MNYLTVHSALKRGELAIFSLQELKNLFPGEKPKTLKNNLTRWVQKGLFTRLKRDLYEWKELCEESVISDLYIANRLYSPSYISLETALSFYSVIPDVAMEVTSVTTLQTRSFKNHYGRFSYHSCQAKTFKGYRLMNYQGQQIRIADSEKALADFVYFRLRQGIPLDFKEDRFSRPILKKLHWKKVFLYASLPNRKTLKTLQSLRRSL